MICLHLKLLAPVMNRAHEFYMNDNLEGALQLYLDALEIYKWVQNTSHGDCNSSAGEQNCEQQFRPAILQRNIRFKDVIGMDVSFNGISSSLQRNNFR